MSITASADGAAKLSMDQKFAEPGETVEIALNLENFDASWTGLEFLVNYDPKLEVALDGAGDIDYSYGDAIGAMGKKISVGGAISKDLTADGLKGFAFAWAEDRVIASVFLLWAGMSMTNASSSAFKSPFKSSSCEGISSLPFITTAERTRKPGCRSLIFSTTGASLLSLLHELVTSTEMVLVFGCDCAARVHAHINRKPVKKVAFIRNVFNKLRQN